MKWPPNKAWTSVRRRQGYRHFEVKQYGGKGKDRWVELFPVLEKQIRLSVSWSELKTHTEWTSGWLLLPDGEVCNNEANVMNACSDKSQ